MPNPEKFRMLAAMRAAQEPEQEDDGLSGGTIGQAAGGILGTLAGQFLIPVPGVGAALGGAAGSALGGVVGSAIDEDEDVSVERTLTDTNRLAAALAQYSAAKGA